MSFTRPVLHAERQTVYEDDTRSGQVLEEMHKVVVCEKNEFRFWVLYKMCKGNAEKKRVHKFTTFSYCMLIYK